MEMPTFAVLFIRFLHRHCRVVYADSEVERDRMLISELSRLAVLRGNESCTCLMQQGQSHARVIHCTLPWEKRAQWCMAQYAALVVCFEHRVCGFVFGDSPADRDSRLESMLIAMIGRRETCACVVNQRGHAGIIYCTLP